MWRLLLNGYNEQLTGQSPVLAAGEDSLLAFRQSQTSRPRLAALLKRALLPRMDRLERTLQREGRAELARECFGVIPTLAKLDLAGFLQLFEH